MSTVNALLPSLMQRMGVATSAYTGGGLVVCSPIDGSELGRAHIHTQEDVANTVASAQQSFMAWRHTPAPRRGELIRLLGEELRLSKNDLGQLISLEAGKVLSEGLGEVQEMIDVCDFAVGLSRQLYGLTIASERPGHRMMETWHPLGVCGVISAFNFPHGSGSGPECGATVCPQPAGIGWKQCRHHHAQRRSGFGGAWHSFCCRGYCWTTLHHHATPYRAFKHQGNPA